MITTRIADWTSEDVEKLRNFLGTTTGTKFLALLALNRPPLLKTGTDAEIFIRSGEVMGFEIALSEIEGMTAPIQSEIPKEEGYPSVDDDTKWKDTEPKTE